MGFGMGNKEFIRRMDRHVGRRMRERRIELGMSQTNLAKPLGVSYQQLGKFESGINRLSAGRLLVVAELLDVDLEYFFFGATSEARLRGIRDARQFSERPDKLGAR